MKKIKLFRYSGSKELDLRKEMNRFMFGAPDEIAKGSLFILRRMRRNLGVAYPVDSKDLEACDCKSNGYENEPDLDYRCDICDGEGYLFDDEVVVGYKMIQFQITDTETYHAWGKNTVSRNLIYLESHELPSRFDKIIEPVIDEDGFVQTPIRLLRRHNIHQAEWLRADNGRLEYIRCACFED